MTTERSGMSLESVVSFLLGESELDGVWFGEKHERRRGSFWWRDILRAAYADHLSRDAVVSDEDVERACEAFAKKSGRIWPTGYIKEDHDALRDAIRAALESLASRKVAVLDGWVVERARDGDSIWLRNGTASICFSRSEGLIHWFLEAMLASQDEVK